MMRLAWLTDIHLNFVDALTMQRFFESVAEKADAVAVSGDIAESHGVYHYLRSMDEIVDAQRLRPILMALADEAARHFESVLEAAASEFPSVIAVTHVPPFRQDQQGFGRVVRLLPVLPPLSAFAVKNAPPCLTSPCRIVGYCDYREKWHT